jgi:peroxiredoxin Q/BCP
MSTTTLKFELPNVAAGPDPLSLSDLTSEHDAVVLLFQRDYFCGNCRKQVQAIADRYDEFEALGAEVVSILPESRDRTRAWQENYGLPFPLLADEDAAVADQYDQPTRFGVLGQLHDLIGRMPETVVLDARDGDVTIYEQQKGSTPGDRPSVDDLLDTIRELEE